MRIHIVQNNSMKIKDWLLWFRVKFCLPLSLVYFIAPLVYGITPLRLIGFIPVFLLITAGSLLNDSRDFKQDCFNDKKKNKPLQRGIICPQKNKVVAKYLMYISILFSIPIMYSFPIAIPVYLVSLLMPLIYWYWKDTPPWDYVVDVLLLPLPIIAGFNVCGLYPGVELMIGVILICTVAYFHDMIYDLPVDVNTSVKVIAKKSILIPHILLWTTNALFLVLMPTLFGVIIIVGYNLVFYYAIYSRNWFMYTYATILFPGMYLIYELLKIFGITIRVIL